MPNTCFNESHALIQKSANFIYCNIKFYIAPLCVDINMRDDKFRADR